MEEVLLIRFVYAAATYTPHAVVTVIVEEIVVVEVS
jgi:hypothetical protein